MSYKYRAARKSCPICIDLVQMTVCRNIIYIFVVLTYLWH
jgi:hypothetical protein